LLDNNLKLVEEGKGKLAVSLIGHAGCGKTAIIKELAQDRGAGYTRLNLSELEEVGD
jgi:MoxR-like ATPase